MITFTFNGLELQGEQGQSVAAALLANQLRATRYTRVESKPRGLFCGIGICFDCLLVINGQGNQKSCITEIKEGMSVTIQYGN